VADNRPKAAASSSRIKQPHQAPESSSLTAEFWRAQSDAEQAKKRHQAAALFPRNAAQARTLR
jgi:hypothetical protein